MLMSNVYHNFTNMQLVQIDCLLCLSSLIGYDLVKVYNNTI